MITGCSLDQSTISSPCHQDVEIWKIYDSATDSLTYTTQALIHEIYGSPTITVTANTGQSWADNILTDDGDNGLYWTAQNTPTDGSTAFELEIEFDSEMCIGGFHIRNGLDMPTYPAYPVETTFEFYVTGDTSTPSYTFTDYL